MQHSKTFLDHIAHLNSEFYGLISNLKENGFFISVKQVELSYLSFMYEVEQKFNKPTNLKKTRKAN